PGPLVRGVPAWPVTAFSAGADRNAAHALEADMAVRVGKDHIKSRDKPGTGGVPKFATGAGAIHAKQGREPTTGLKTEPAERHRPARPGRWRKKLVHDRTVAARLDDLANGVCSADVDYFLSLPGGFPAPVIKEAAGMT